METRAPRLVVSAFERRSLIPIALSALLWACGGQAPAATPESAPSEPGEAVAPASDARADASEPESATEADCAEPAAAPADHPNETRDLPDHTTPGGPTTQEARPKPTSASQPPPRPTTPTKPGT